MVDPASLPNLPALLSTSRMRPYLAACSGNADQAVRLYTWNVEVAGAFWGELHILEVGVRNAIHSGLSRRYKRDDWWNAPSVVLHAPMKRQLNAAVGHAAETAAAQTRPPVADDIVAHLMLGFWSGLLGPGGGAQYETRYWLPALRHAFPGYSGTRRDLHQNLERLRLLRNRIAHHEPVHKRDLGVDHALVTAIAGYIHSDLSALIGSHSRVLDVLKRRADAVSGVLPTAF